VYVILHTDDPIHTKGYGLTFTLGRGNEVVAACVKALEHHLIGADFDNDIVNNMMDSEDHRGFYYRLCQDGQLRWIGPEKGTIAMACGAIMNAVWDLMARRAEKPLWLYIAEMAPEQLIEMVDFKHIADYVSKEEGLALLQKIRPGWEKRVEYMKNVGFRAYTTSCGWLGYPEDVVRQKCRESIAEGHQHFKMKVGSSNVQEDVKRARWIREEIGDDMILMMDANQKWNVDQAVVNMKILAQAPFKPIWIEEPTNCDDVVGHATVARALESVENGVCGVATGEAASNKIIFKQLLQLNAIRYCQIDSCRVAGVNEILAILLMSAKAGVKVCPHAGGVGLCEYVRHLCMIDFICFNPVDAKDRVCESITDSKGYFYDPCTFNKRHDGLFYLPATAPGYAQFKEHVLTEYIFPYGPVWQKEEKGQKVMSDMVKNAEFVLQKCGSGTCTNSGKKQQSMGVVTALTVVAAVAAGYYFLSKR
jgi:L-fuconate dehydratase